jgi:Peptidase M50B-like
MVAELLGAAQDAHHSGAAATSPPSQAVVVSTGLVVTALVAGLWALAGHVIVLAHEGAHAATTVLLGGRVRRITLSSNREGATLSQGAALRFPVTAAGYIGPSAFGLAGSALLARGFADSVLWISLVLLGLLLVTSMNWFGRFLVVAVGAGLFLTLRDGSPAVRTVVACAWVWLLLIGGLAHVWKHRAGGADFVRLGSITFVLPAFVWAGLALVATSAALVAAAAWMLGALSPPFS